MHVAVRRKPSVLFEARSGSRAGGVGTSQERHNRTQRPPICAFASARSCGRSRIALVTLIPPRAGGARKNGYLPTDVLDLHIRKRPAHSLATRAPAGTHGCRFPLSCAPANTGVDSGPSHDRGAALRRKRSTESTSKRQSHLGKPAEKMSARPRGSHSRGKEQIADRSLQGHTQVSGRGISGRVTPSAFIMGPAYRPFQIGSRFSAKARAPSKKSSEEDMRSYIAKPD